MQQNSRWEKRGRVVAGLYRAGMAVLGAALPIFASKGSNLAERLALSGEARSGTIWIHGASVGELTSARTLILALAERFAVVVTSNSLTGRKLIEGWGLPARLAPLDVPGALRRFLAQMRPVVAVTIESEIWPNRARALRVAGVPQVVVGARMSERSAKRWDKMPAVIAPVLAGIDTLSAQDAMTETRLLSLGLQPDALAPRLDLKLLGPSMLQPDPGPRRAETMLAASTHEGEDAVVLDAYLQARQAVPDLRLILAPRHPERADAVEALMRQRGLGAARRSHGEDEAAPVLLADTLGEMRRWYDAAGICVTGGSFTDVGGHTPWEPAAHECAILHGPHVANFTDSYRRLDAAGASLPVTADTLGGALAELAADPAKASVMGVTARQVLVADAGDAAPLIERIAELATQAGNDDIFQRKG